MRRMLWSLVAGLAASSAAAVPHVRVAEGNLQGVDLPGLTPLSAYLGIPYAAPPIGPLRWKPPRPAAHWRGIRLADRFGARCMQQPLFADMMFRSPGPSEDCLTLNVWTPGNAKRGSKLPVLFYIHGGGAIAGDGSERRYDGASLARQGIVVVTLNYRLGVFGFLATEELAAESPDHAAGNYGLLDQAAALAWVRHNIVKFGGDPKRITIGGESAGSMSVSVLMTSPLTRTHFAQAIGESGGIFPPAFHPKSLAAAEQDGRAFSQAIGAMPLASMRAMPADQLLEAQGRLKVSASFIVDGRFLTEPPIDSYAGGRSAHVPLLVGSNSQENGWSAILGDAPPTITNYRAGIARLYGDRADALFGLYPASTDADVPAAATALASDRFLAASTWKWFDMHRRTGQPTYYYYFTRIRPQAFPPIPNPTPSPSPTGALHSAEIEYALGNLDANPAYAWTADDYRISKTMQGYFTAFIKTGDPNSPGLPRWSPAPTQDGLIQRQTIDTDTHSMPFTEHSRYEAALPLLDEPKAEP